MYKNQKNIALLVMIFLFSTTMSAQCAMCKAVVETGDTSMAEGINSGISYLMVFPYILIGVLLYFVYRNKKKAKN